MTPMKLGHVHLKVRELDRSVAFYTTLFGLLVEERLEGFAFLNDGLVHHSIALQELGPLAPRAHPLSVGLYHVAFEVESDEAFRAFEVRLSEMGIRHQSVDHGISWATYFNDPDGNGLEVYVDRRHAAGGRAVWDGSSTRVSSGSA